VDPVQKDEAEFLGHEAEPGADIIALPQLERLPPNPDIADAGAGSSSFTADNRSARLEALELVRAAVELADRIERDAQETAKDRLTRTEEEVRLRRLALDEREVELDHFKRDLEGARQQLIQTEQELEEQRRQRRRVSRPRGRSRPRRSRPQASAPRRCRRRHRPKPTASLPLPGPRPGRPLRLSAWRRRRPWQQPAQRRRT